MTQDIPPLDWRRFGLQFGSAAIAFAAGVYGYKLLNGVESNYGLAVNLIMLPLVLALLSMRVPYKKDEFERRLRNWSMTQSAVWVFMSSVAFALLGYRLFPEIADTVPFVTPAAFLMVHAVYSHYLRFCVLIGKRNAFSDGTRHCS